MKKLFQKLLAKLVKKAINKSVNDAVSNPDAPDVDPIVRILVSCLGPEAKNLT